MAQVSRQRPILIINDKVVRCRTCSITPVIRYSDLHLSVVKDAVPVDAHLERFEVDIVHLDGSESRLLKYEMEVCERPKTRRRIISLSE